MGCISIVKKLVEQHKVTVEPTALVILTGFGKNGLTTGLVKIDFFF